MVKLFKVSSGVAAAILLSAAALASSASAAVIYNVNQAVGGGKVTGTIATDGTVGVLGASNFTSWNLKLDGVGASYQLDQSNSLVDVSGPNLSATPTQLLFNFDAPPNGYLLFQLTADHLTGRHYYCAASNLGTCYQGQTVTPESILDPSVQMQGFSGSRVIGEVAPVPEPAVWSMMILGMAGMGGVLRRRRQASLSLA
jgi:hypothetical protein